MAQKRLERIGLGPSLLVVMVLVAACGIGQTSTAPGQLPDLNITYFQNAAPQHEHIIATQPTLTKLVPANIKWLPITNGPAALAGMKSGAFDIAAEVGNPPITGAIAKGIDFKIIWIESHDDAGFVVKSSITNPSQMAGKTFATPVGSSEDFAFEGWLQQNGLVGKVKLVNIPDRQAMVAAFKTGSVDGAMDDGPQMREMIAAGGRLVVTETDIANQYPQFAVVNTVSVSTSYAAQHKDVVQGYVCALLGATKLALGPDRNTVFMTAAAFAGEAPDQAVTDGNAWPFVPPEKELAQLGSGTDLSTSAVVQSLQNTAKFLVSQGQIDSAPSLSDIEAHVDPSFAQNALNNKC